MPFKSKSQMRLCYAVEKEANDQGYESSWDCDRWKNETKNVKKLPERVPKKRAARKKSSKKVAKKAAKKTTRKRVNPSNLPSGFYLGPRGGIYFYGKNRRKIYVQRQ